MDNIGIVKRKKDLKDAEIESKDQRWHSRNRITLVFGSNDVEDLETYIYTDTGVEFKTIAFHQAKSKAIEEILDNCIDEFYRGHVTEIHTTLSEDKAIVTIADNGIGFPLDKIRTVYTEFRTGSKFKDEEMDENGFLYRTLGQNGLGAAATCLTSDFFKVTVKHYISKKEQTYLFIDGASQVKKAPSKSFSGASGVKVELSLAKEVYKNNLIDEDLLRKRIIDLAYNNPGLTFYFNGEKYLFKKGLWELALRLANGIESQSINNINASTSTPTSKEEVVVVIAVEAEEKEEEADSPKASLGNNVSYHIGNETFIFEGENDKGDKFKAKIDLTLSINFRKTDNSRERIISFVNSTPTYDGGFHHDRLKKIFTAMVKEKLERAGKREGIVITDNDALTGITFIMGITMPNPRFESQTKRKLVRDNFLEKALSDFLAKYVDRAMKKDFGQGYLSVVIERARYRQRFEELKDATKKAKQQKKTRVEKLLDANERKDRSKCTLFICEGDSAIGGLRSARDKLYQGGIALKGKPMNITQASIKDVLANQELCDIMAAIGLVLGSPADPEKLRYSKIVFLADSDVDGGHINTLLTNFFFAFWPELFEMGLIEIAKAPLYEIITDTGKIYAETLDELETIKKKDIKIKEIQRNKGLGEMSPEAFKELLARKNFTKIKIKDINNARRMLEICFGKDANLRKDLLIEH